MEGAGGGSNINFDFNVYLGGVAGFLGTISFGRLKLPKHKKNYKKLHIKEESSYRELERRISFHIFRKAFKTD